MLPEFLLTENVVREDGVGPGIELPFGYDGLLLVTLGITRIVEQESLLVSLWGSADGNDWGDAPIAVFPQKFYCGTYSQTIDLTDYPNLRFLRARWNVNRWGRGEFAPPLFGFYLRAQAINVEVTAEAVA